MTHSSHFDAFDAAVEGRDALDSWYTAIEQTANAPSLLRGTGIAGLILLPVRGAQIFVRKAREIGYPAATRLAFVVVASKARGRR